MVNLAFPGSKAEKKKIASMAYRLMTPAQFRKGWELTEWRDKCRIGDWNSQVYAGVMEREEGDDLFGWCDVNWKLAESQLMDRAVRWNKALEKCCNDEGLTGE